MHEVKITTTWTDTDANGHVGNTSYSKYATHARVAVFAKYGLPPHRFLALRSGPVLIREELRYFKELYMLEEITVNCKLKATTRDYRKFSFLQEIHNAKGVMAATVEVDGLWLNLDTRRSSAPPPEIQEVCARFSHTEDFAWIEE